MPIATPLGEATMADQIQNQTQKTPKQNGPSDPLNDIQQGFNKGYDAKQDQASGEQTPDEMEELTNVLNPIQPKPADRHPVHQSNADSDNKQKRQAERGGS